MTEMCNDVATKGGTLMEQFQIEINVDEYWPSLSADLDLTRNDLAILIANQEGFQQCERMFQRIRRYKEAIIAAHGIYGDALLRKLLKPSRDRAIMAMVKAYEEDLAYCEGANVKALWQDFATQLIDPSDSSMPYRHKMLASTLIHMGWLRSSGQRAMNTVLRQLRRVERVVAENNLDFPREPFGQLIRAHIGVQLHMPPPRHEEPHRGAYAIA